MYSVKAVSQATGISPETLRAWERRYGAVNPVREPNGRRSYNHDDVTRLRKLKQLSELGHTISRLAPLSRAELDELCDTLEGELLATGTAEMVNRLLEATQRSDEAACDELLAQALCILSPRRLVCEVLSPALVETGERWHAGSVSIGQEHLLSTRVRRLLMSLINTYRSDSASKHVVFATHSGEQHTIGSLFAAYIAASLGTRATYLDSEMPPSELDKLARQMKAQAVALSIVDKHNTAEALSHLTRLCELAGGAYGVWIGGACAAELDTQQRLPPGCTYLSSIDELEAWLTLPAVS